MIKCKIKRRGKKKILTISGEMNVNHADELKSSLIESFKGVIKGVKEVIVNLQEINEMDLSAIQLLYSAYQTSKSLQKLLFIEGCSSEVLLRAVEDSGFKRHINCLFRDGKADSKN
jgi:anti-anti-sigma factor